MPEYTHEVQGDRGADVGVFAEFDAGASALLVANPYGCQDDMIA
jgi:hypothetical protein